MAINFAGEGEEPDIRMCWRHEIYELGSGPDAPRNHRNAARLHEVMGLFGRGGKDGPLMKACIHNAEHLPMGGHRHMLPRKQA